MLLSLQPRRIAGLACAALLALVVSACGSTVSTSAFKGEQHAVAQAIANLQTDATAAEPGKICQNDLAATVVARLGGRSGCETAIKSQLTEIDSLELSVQSIKIDPAAHAATASVKSTRSGKKTVGALVLANEAGKWKVSSLG